MSTMWEVDPETRTKLAEIQKKPGNNLCADCNAPAPQWASPKFGTFICLTCAGTHRGLGVHISFVRSITMDAFKTAEIARMDLGGNAAFRSFFSSHEDTLLSGVGWDESTVAERYGGDVGEEYKERLTAKVEGREYVKSEKPKTKPVPKPVARTMGAGGKGASRDASPSSVAANGAGTGGRKEKNEQFFAKLGSENASRPEDLPPSQGGRYAGFGSAPPPAASAGGGAGGGKGGDALPGLEDLQKDPVAAVSKSFGWFAGVVGKGAKSVNDGFIAPAAQKIAEADLAAQARTTASTLGQTVQTGAKGAAETFNRFVEDSGTSGPGGARGRAAPIDETKKDFWDTFGGAGAAAGARGSEVRASSIGTAAMKRNVAEGSAAGANKKEDDEWEKF